MAQSQQGGGVVSSGSEALAPVRSKRTAWEKAALVGRVARRSVAALPAVAVGTAAVVDLVSTAIGKPTALRESVDWLHGRLDVLVDGSWYERVASIPTAVVVTGASAVEAVTIPVDTLANVATPESPTGEWIERGVIGAGDAAIAFVAGRITQTIYEGDGMQLLGRRPAPPQGPPQA